MTNCEFHLFQFYNFHDDTIVQNSLVFILDINADKGST